MSSMAGQSDHIDHVRTQLPYALTVAAIVAAGYGALALTGELWVAWVTNVVLLAAVFLVAWLAAGRLDRRVAA
jgi:Na+/H+ antiporter NhaC